MKKILTILFILSIIGTLQAEFLKDFSFSTSLSVRNSQIKDIFDYEIALEFDKANLFYCEIEKERENGISFYNHEFKITYNRPYLSTNAKWLNIQSNDIDLKQIDVRGVYSKYNLGFAQQWSDNMPSTKLICGVKYDFKIFIILDFVLMQDFMTQNFSDWNTDTLCKVSFDIYLFSVYWKSTIKNYGNLDWKSKMGVSFKF